MSKDNSPRYAAGFLDGKADADRIMCCPPNVPYGPEPPDPRYPVMYEAGYHDAFDSAVAHVCTEACKR